jgi:HEPN domain-containing protein
MTTKRQILDGLTREQLKALASEFEIEFDHAWTKDQFVEALANSRRLDSVAVEELAAGIVKTGDVPAAVRTARQDFFTETAGAVFDQVSEFSEGLAVAIAAREVVEPGFVTEMLARGERMRKGKINQVREVPSHVWSKFSGKQKGAFGTAKSLSYQIPKFVDSAIQSALASETVGGYTKWKSRKLPDRIEYYVLQAYRSYTARCYDATIVMIARAFEHLLKGLLTSKSVPYSKKATLGQLVDLYRTGVANDKVLEKILEVANMDRIISAHDIEPYDRQMQAEDANHAWTALEIVLRELLPPGGWGV